MHSICFCLFFIKPAGATTFPPAGFMNKNQSIGVFYGTAHPGKSDGAIVQYRLLESTIQKTTAQRQINNPTIIRMITSRFFDFFFGAAERGEPENSSLERGTSGDM